MLGIYGNTWASQFGISPVQAGGELTRAGEAWSSALVGLTPRHLAAGVAAAQRSGNEFPPNAARFRILAMGVPSLTDVESELAPGSERSPFTVQVTQFLDLHRYRTGDGRDQARLLRAAYEKALAHLQAGKPLPAPMAALPQERYRAPTVADRDRSRAAMLRAMAELGQGDSHVQEGANP